jgi:Ca-activated chloride channel family protein
VTPRTAAEAAAALDIKVYTIGAGPRGMAPYPATDLFGNKVYRPMPVDIDEKTLEEISKTTKARYFRATDTDSLREIYAEIDRSEKTPSRRAVPDWREFIRGSPGGALALLEIDRRHLAEKLP